jgi:hypothetical protein
VPIRSGADRKKWTSRVLTTAPMLLGRVARGLSVPCQTWAAPGTTGRSARSRRLCPVRRGTRWRRRGGGGANGDGAGPGRIRSAPGDRQHRSPVAPKPRPRPHRQDKHWATTERSERKFRPTVVSQADQLRAPRTAVTNSLEQTFCALTSLTRWVSLLFDCAPGWPGAQVKIGSGRERMMTRGEWIIQLTKIALGVAIAAYFMWWSLEVLQRLPPR